MSSLIVNLNNRSDLQAFAAVNGLRNDWHEPDEQGISARIVGGHLDNAMGATAEDALEYNVILTKEIAFDHLDGDTVAVDIAVVNLATLLSWASEK